MEKKCEGNSFTIITVFSLETHFFLSSLNRGKQARKINIKEQ
jgi:hypothetical protein